MEKKLIVTRNMNRDLKSTTPKVRSKDFVNEKHFAIQNLKQYHQSHNNHRTQHKQFSRTKLSDFQCAAVSLSNEEYIHATSQIWLNQECLKINFDFSDIYSQWDSIIQINFYTTEEIVCPICLDTPKVGRTDKCGHIYCFTCLNKFLSYENGFYKKCALCNQHIDVKRVKRASFIQRFSLNVGDNISMLLMRRNKLDSFPVPINMNDIGIPYVYSNESRFSNTAVCSNEDLKSIIQIDTIALEDELVDAIRENSDRIEAISEALEITKNELKLSSCLPVISKQLTLESSLIEINNLIDIMRINNVYYQAEDGSNIFMCPLNWKCMHHEFIDNQNCLPLRVTGKIIEIEKFTVTPEFINRYRYLKYLPIGTQISFVEIDLANIISDSTLLKFRKEIQRKTDDRFYKEQLDEVLTSEKIKHENSFNSSSGFFCLSSLMKETDRILDDDFVPLCPNVPKSPVDGNMNILTDKKLSFAELMHLKKPQTSSQLVVENNAESNPDISQSRGFSLEDCLVKKRNKRHKK